MENYLSFSREKVEQDILTYVAFNFPEVFDSKSEELKKIMDDYFEKVTLIMRETNSHIGRDLDRIFPSGMGNPYVFRSVKETIEYKYRIKFSPELERKRLIVHLKIRNLVDPKIQFFITEHINPEIIELQKYVFSRYSDFLTPEVLKYLQDFFEEYALKFAEIKSHANKLRNEKNYCTDHLPVDHLLGGNEIEEAEQKSFKGIFRLCKNGYRYLLGALRKTSLKLLKTKKIVIIRKNYNYFFMLSTKLTKSLLRTTDNYIKALEKAGILTVSDFLNHFPRDYDDRTNVLDSFSLINIKEKNTILVKLLSINSQKTANNKLLTKAVLEDKNGFLAEAVWFNRKYLTSQLKIYEQKKVIISGKVKYAFGKVTFQSPETETNLDKLEGQIVPIYPELNYIPSKWIEGKMGLLKSYIKEFSEDLPENIIKKYNFISRRDAISKIHFPKNKNDIEISQYRLAYSELFAINYKAISEKHLNFANSEGKSIAIALNPERVKELLAYFPFEFTDHQKIALFQILKDMEKSHSMQRLLEGDVGTGKTAVAFVAGAYGILESGKNRIQAAIMAPTEILARQHFEGMQDFLMHFGISSHLLVGSLTAKQKKAVKEDIKQGNIDIVIGTHALVQEDVVFNNLGFVVVDEQHRFGVKQREKLENYHSQVVEVGKLQVTSKKENNKGVLIPHNLNMTATPIPRTLALTLYGDQDLSIISEYPKGRKEIFTKVAKNEEERLQIENFVRAEIEKGRQVFWISPLVEESEKIDLANAINTYENLQNIFHPYKVGLLHGKMKGKEKDSIMKSFQENKIQILSSTSVVEVGVDVPNATIMCIEGAERFGLSQLHQFRGRVGRGNHQSYCYLFPTKGQKTDRLKAMEKTNNGFELAEIDLELRGPGEVYGVKQSGLPDLKIAKLTDLELISQIREDIEEMFE